MSRNRAQTAEAPDRGNDEGAAYRCQPLPRCLISGVSDGLLFGGLDRDDDPSWSPARFFRQVGEELKLDDPDLVGTVPAFRSLAEQHGYTRRWDVRIRLWWTKRRLRRLMRRSRG